MDQNLEAVLCQWKRRGLDVILVEVGVVEVMDGEVVGGTSVEEVGVGTSVQIVGEVGMLVEIVGEVRTLVEVVGEVVRGTLVGEVVRETSVGVKTIFLMR